LKICPKCSTEFEDKFNFCRLDGTSLQVKALAKPCPGCGKETEEGKKFCRDCGVRLDSKPEKSDQLVDRASIDSNIPKAEPAPRNLLPAQFPFNYASEKAQQDIEQIRKSCAQCGMEVEAGKKFCRHCGARIESSTEGAPRKVEMPHVQEVVSHQQIPPEPPKPAAKEKVTEKIEPQVIQQQEIAQQTVAKQESPIEAAERHFKEGNYKNAIAALESTVKNNPADQEARLVHLLASIRLYNVYGYETQVESIKSLSNLSEKERGIAREIFLIRSDEARNRGQEDDAREYQRLASRVILGQSLAEKAPEAKAVEPPTQRGEVKPFPERKAERVTQSPPKTIPSLEEKIAPPRREVANEQRRRSRGVLISTGIILGVAGILGGGVLAYYAKRQGISISDLYGKIFSAREIPGQENRLSGKTDVAQVLAAEELGFRVWGTGAVDVNRRKSLLSEKIASQLDGVRNFYQQQIQIKPSLMGSITLQLTVSPSGQVTRVEEFGAQIKDSEFKKSVIGEAYKWRFPEATSGLVQINYPLLFLPPGMDIATLVKWEQSISPRALATKDSTLAAGEDAETSDQSIKSSPPEVADARKSPPSVPSPQPKFEETKVSRFPSPSSRQPVQQTPAPELATAVREQYEVLYPTSVYKEPREDSEKVASIPAGITVNVVAIRGDWLEVRSKQGNPPGFIKRNSVAPIGNR
jgi:hypothetical protein